MKQLFLIFLFLIVNIFQVYSQQSDSIVFKECYELYEKELKKEAYDCFERFDTSLKAVYNLALIALEIGDSSNFINQSNKLISNQFYSPKSISWYLDLHHKDSLQCLPIVDTALKKFINDTLLLQYKVNCLYRNLEYLKVIDAVNHLFSIKKVKDTANLCYQAIAYENLKEDDKALSSYENALEIDSLCLIANYNSGVIYFNNGIEKYNKTLSIFDEEEAEKLIEFANSYFENALPFFERLYNMDNSNVRISNTVMNLYDRLGIENDIAYQKTNDYKVEINKNYWETLECVEEQYDSKYYLRLHFQSDFDNDSVVVKRNGEFYGKYKLTTNHILGKAKIIKIPDFENIETITISVNGGKEATFGIKELNQIAIAYNGYILQIRYLKHIPTYE